MVGLGRVELPTRSLGNCCSIHLSYSPARKDYYVFAGVENPTSEELGVVAQALLPVRLDSGARTAHS